MEEIIKKILENRGIKKKEEFFSPEISHLTDPFEIPYMKEGCDLLRKVIEKKEKVFLYADGDVDGIFSIYFIIKVLQKTGTDFLFYITHRLDSYEIEENIIPYLKKESISLFISVDCGISSVNFLKEVKKEGIKVIVIDHHIFNPAFLPEGNIYINPKLYNCLPEIKFLSSTALVQKFTKGLSYSIPVEIEENLELVAIATIADNCPLIGENRKIIKMGLEKIFSTEIKGLKILIDELNIGEKNLIKDLKMKLIPKLNSPGRFGKPEIILDLLLSEKVEEIIKEVKEIDRKRYKITKDCLEKIKEKIEKETFIVEKDILPSICGILSSRLSYETNRPVAIASEKNGMIQGSARCPEFYNLQKFIEKTKKYMISSGGHQNAIGFTFKVEFLDNIKKEWENFISNEKEEVFYYDAEIELDKITPTFLKELSKFAPFGPGNPEPVFLSRRVKVEKIIREKEGELVFWVRKDNSIFECILKSSDENIVSEKFIDIFYIPRYRENNGLYRIYLLVKNFNKSF